MTKSLSEIQKENRKFILEAIHGCSYEEALKKEYAKKGNNTISVPFREYEGEELTISKVLLALKSKEDLFNPKRYEICLGTGKLFYYDYSKNIELVLDLAKETLEKQTEETQRRINELSNN